MTAQNMLPGRPGSEPADAAPELAELYEGFQRESLIPLWTEIGDLMPTHPQPRAVPHLWRWRAGLRRWPTGRRARSGGPRR